MKWRCPLQATLTTLTVQDIYTWVQRFCQQHPLPKRCGRPQKYPETLLLTLLLFSVHEHVSYRRLLFALTPERFPNQPLSALGALVYRFHPLCAQRVHQLLSCFLWWLWMRGLWAFFFEHPLRGGILHDEMATEDEKWLTESEARVIAEQARRLITAVEQVILGKTDTVRMMVIGLLSRGHLLIEDIPGVGKTTLARAIARAIGGQFRRIQFTPDLLPADVTGSVIYNQKTGQFEFHPGPIFANIVLADEINRATPKTQSALLEAMEERTVSIEGTSHPLPEPFLVIATQNNIEMVGTYPLPEAQMDRFFARVSLGYPSPEVEVRILQTRQVHSPLEALQPVLTPEQLLALQEAVRRVYVSPAVRRYIVEVVTATRHHPQIALGASPRGSLALMTGSQALAVLNGRHYVIPDDVQRMAISVLAHRLIVRADVHGALPRGEQVIQQILKQVPVPVEGGNQG